MNEPDLQVLQDNTRDNGSRRQPVPIVIQGLSFVALTMLVFVVVPAAVVRREQLFIVLPILLLLIGVYWIFRNNPGVSALYFALAISLGAWIFACENIVVIDNVLGSQVTRSLRLGMPLQIYAKNNLKERKGRKNYVMQECCNDALSYNYRPGSLHRSIYDCPTCSEPYETIVDSTGHLNRQSDVIESGGPVDLFVGGDSVLEGAGVPSVVEVLSDILPVKIWNVSIGGYGPRQKAQSLIVYALPRHPKWLILDFYAGNDLNDAIIHEACEASGTFHCLFNLSEKRRLLLRHPVFASMVVDTATPGLFDEYTENNFTLAVTRYVIENVKATIKTRLRTPYLNSDDSKQTVDQNQVRRLSRSDVSKPGGNFEFTIREERILDWLKEGMLLTQKHYDRLAVQVNNMQSPPRVILLYNPSAYEIYRDIKIERDNESDHVSDFLRAALHDYADKQGWTFLDVTLPLREEVSRTGLWLYGVHDRAHWSKQGTVAVAPVLARELINVMGRPTTTPVVTLPSEIGIQTAGKNLR